MTDYIYERLQHELCVERARSWELARQLGNKIDYLRERHAEEVQSLRAERDALAEDLLTNSHMLAKLWDRAGSSILGEYTDDSHLDQPEPPWCDDDDCDYQDAFHERLDGYDDRGHAR